MLTKGYFVEQAMKRANVWEGSTAEQREDCLRAFEAMVWEWANQKQPILFNYPLEDAPTWNKACPHVPRNFEAALIANGAIKASLALRIPVTQDLGREARETKDQITPTFAPSSARSALVGFPKGSGTSSWGCRHPRFIPPQRPLPEESF